MGLCTLWGHAGCRCGCAGWFHPLLVHLRITCSISPQPFCVCAQIDTTFPQTPPELRSSTRNASYAVGGVASLALSRCVVCADADCFRADLDMCAEMGSMLTHENMHTAHAYMMGSSYANCIMSACDRRERTRTVHMSTTTERFAPPGTAWKSCETLCQILFNSLSNYPP